MSTPVLALGPQRPAPNLRDALDAEGVTGPLALITAGWRVDELEIDALKRHAGVPILHLPLYAWFEALMAADPALKRTYRQRQDRILALKELYRLRLLPALAAVDDLRAHNRRHPDAPDLGVEELEDALRGLRTLDDRVVEGVARIRADVPTLERPWDHHPAVRARYDEIVDTLDRASALAIAGGHIGVLRNRMQLFGFSQHLPRLLAQGQPIVAWAGGVMTLTERVVIYYDDPPQGISEAEVFSPGFGLLPGVVLFPHARRRLRLDDPDRLERLVARFHPRLCLGMENGAWMSWRGADWTDHSRPDTLLRLADLP
ncbi:MAG: hypothetical protein H6739_11170 [Alphaproteobacteria bacterium]|nr:hypothetical protein [Alphaproteobacteria bacterium]